MGEGDYVMSKSIVYNGEKYLLAKTTRYGVIQKERLYISSKARNQDDKIKYNLLVKRNPTWYFMLVVLPFYFLGYIFSCLLIVLCCVLMFRFGALLYKDNYTKNNGVYRDFMDILNRFVYPDFFTSYYILSDVPLTNKELIAQAKNKEKWHRRIIES